MPDGMVCPIWRECTLKACHPAAHVQALHLHLFADDLATWLPSGLAGGIGMIRNWMFTLFYVSSELWGDIVLSLLFWGLANETTTLHEAALLYPLFGVGANIGQVRAILRETVEVPCQTRSGVLTDERLETFARHRLHAPTGVRGQVPSGVHHTHCPPAVVCGSVAGMQPPR